MTSPFSKKPEKGRTHRFVLVLISQTEVGLYFSTEKWPTRLGQKVEARAYLIALEKLARDKGFGLIAGKARSVRNSGTKEVSLN